MSFSEDDLEMGRREWDRMAGALKREGFREGMNLGREESFQKGFDAGYKTGFASGFTLGSFNGFLRFVEVKKELKELLDEAEFKCEPHEKAARGACLICPSGKKSLNREDMSNAQIPLDKPIDAVVREQEDCIKGFKVKNDLILDEIRQIITERQN